MPAPSRVIASQVCIQAGTNEPAEAKGVPTDGYTFFFSACNVNGQGSNFAAVT